MDQTNSGTVLFCCEDLKRMIDVGVFAGRKERIELVEGANRIRDRASTSAW